MGKPLYEQYRPTSWEQVLGQSKVIDSLRAIEKRGGFGGNAFWLTGPSGRGKTTIARLIANSFAADYATFELDASRVTPSDVEQWQRQFRGKPLGSNGWAVILDEAHGLRKDTIRSLLVALEPIPDHAVWIFTTTKEGHESLFEDQIDAHPLLSRCKYYKLSERDLAADFAVYAQKVARSEGLDGKPVTNYMRLVNECRSNLRLVLQRIESGEMLG
jgi:DNA polymerase III gamma/tau subunit